MSTETRPITNAMVLIAELAKKLGVSNIKALPGCWEHQIDEHWKIYLNGHREAVTIASGVSVEPFNCWVEYNGWPAGSFDGFGGVIAAGEGANEETFIEALRARIAREP